VRAREHRRILLAQLDEYEAEGWTAGEVVPVDPVSGGHLAAVLVWRDITHPAPAPEPNLRTLDDQHLIESLLAALAAPGDHGLMLRLDLLQALVRCAYLSGDHERARGLVMQRLELARARDRAGREV